MDCTIYINMYILETLNKRMSFQMFYLLDLTTLITTTKQINNTVPVNQYITFKCVVLQKLFCC